MLMEDGHFCEDCKKIMDIKMDMDTLYIKCDCGIQVEHYFVDNVIRAEHIFQERRRLAKLSLPVKYHRWV